MGNQASRTKAGAPGLLDLPVELLDQCLLALDQRSRLRASLVCKAIAERVRSSPQLWEHLALDLAAVEAFDTVTVERRSALLRRWVMSHAGAVRHLSITWPSAMFDAMENELVGLTAAVVNALALHLHSLRIGGHCVLQFSETMLPACGGLRSLELDNVHTAAFPACVAGLKQLTRLSLRVCNGAKMTFLSDTSRLLGLTELRSLALVNCLAFVPSCLGYLTHLTELDLSGSKLGFFGEAFPGQLSSLKSLQRLDLSNCQAVGLSAALGGLLALRTLLVGGNLIGPGGLPDLGRLLALEHLSLTSCGLGSFPASLTALRALTALDASANSLFALPSGPYLSGLRSLDAHGNRFGAGGPDALRALAQAQQLTALDLSSCALVAVPPEVAGLSHLEGLALNQNGISELPGGPYLASLTALQLNANHFGGGMPLLLRSMGRLRELGWYSHRKKITVADVRRVLLKMPALRQLFIGSITGTCTPAALRLIMEHNESQGTRPIEVGVFREVYA